MAIPLVALQGRPANFGNAFIRGMDAGNRNRLTKSRESLNSAYQARTNQLMQSQIDQQDQAEMQQKEAGIADSMFRFNGMMDQAEREYAGDARALTEIWQGGLKKLIESGVDEDTIRIRGPYDPKTSARKLDQVVQMIPGYQPAEQAKQPPDYTLSPGQQRYSGGRVIADNPKPAEVQKPVSGAKPYRDAEGLMRDGDTNEVLNPEVAGRHRESLYAQEAAKGGLSVPQQSSNRTIDAARAALKGLSRAEITKKIQPVTASGRDNPNYDPHMAGIVKSAMKSKAGDDPEYDTLYKNYFGQTAAQLSPQQENDLQMMREANPAASEEEILNYLRTTKPKGTAGKW